MFHKWNNGKLFHFFSAFDYFSPCYYQFQLSNNSILNITGPESAEDDVRATAST